MDIQDRFGLSSWQKTEMEQQKKREAEASAKEKRDTRRFWITTVLSALAALASVAGVVLQILSGG